jgi:hypothetical protein
MATVYEQPRTKCCAEVSSVAVDVATGPSRMLSMDMESFLVRCFVPRIDSVKVDSKADGILFMISASNCDSRMHVPASMSTSEDIVDETATG